MATAHSASQKLAAYLAHGGVASRRQSEQLILQGKVQVNHQVEKNVARRVYPDQDIVEYQGRVIQPEANRVLLRLYKPVGVVSTVSDPDGKPTVMKYIPRRWQHVRLFPVGRLDEASEGLIILTNDGDMAYRLSHPKFQVPRSYEVHIGGQLSASEKQRLRQGVPLKDGRTQPAEVEIIDEDGQQQVLNITLHEGRHHQIRRMMQALNHPVHRLIRTAHGAYALDDLQPGEWREAPLFKAQ
jgi:23S rRNA pseudouridine2605 synthase